MYGLTFMFHCNRIVFKILEHDTFCAFNVFENTFYLWFHSYRYPMPYRIFKLKSVLGARVVFSHSKIYYLSRHVCFWKYILPLDSSMSPPQALLNHQITNDNACTHVLFCFLWIMAAFSLICVLCMTWVIKKKKTYSKTPIEGMNGCRCIWLRCA